MSALIFALLLASAAHAADKPPLERAKVFFDRDWYAISSTALGVTGDVRFTPTSVTFTYRRATYKLRYISEVTAAQPDPFWRTRDFSLFEVSGANRELLFNGSLCGETKPKPSDPLPHYLALALERPRSADEYDLLMVVFSSQRPPEDVGQAQDHCGDFGYFSKR